MLIREPFAERSWTLRTCDTSGGSGTRLKRGRLRTGSYATRDLAVGDSADGGGADRAAQLKPPEGRPAGPGPANVPGRGSATRRCPPAEAWREGPSDDRD